MSMRPATTTVLISLVLPLVACGENLGAVEESVRTRDSRNEAVEFELQTDGQVLNVCIQNIAESGSAMDVFRVFLHVADSFKDREFESVNLCFRKETRFVLSGLDFLVIGKEFETQNPMYTLRTFPEKLKLIDGSTAYEERRGGLLYVANAQMSDFGDMTDKWYMGELKAEILAERDARRPKEFATDEEAF